VAQVKKHTLAGACAGADGECSPMPRIFAASIRVAQSPARSRSITSPISRHPGNERRDASDEHQLTRYQRRCRDLTVHKPDALRMQENALNCIAEEAIPGRS